MEDTLSSWTTGAGRFRLLQQQRPQFVAGDAVRKPGKIPDLLDGGDLPARRQLFDDVGAHAMACGDHGRGQTGNAGPDDDDICVLHDGLHLAVARQRQSSIDTVARCFAPMICQ